MKKINYKTKFILFLALLILLLNLFGSLSISKTSNLSIEKTDSLPDKFSWKEINGLDYTTPVKNQELCKSDASFALIACLETMVQYELGYPFYCDLSEAHLFYGSGGSFEFGVNISNCTNYLVEFGVADEGCYPYPERSYLPDEYFLQSDWKNRSVKINSWSWLKDDVQVIKNSLVINGPLCGLMNYSFNFVNYESGVYVPRQNSIGKQWVCIIGYDDDLGVWICKNSWGVEWGESGYFKVSYDFKWDKLIKLNGTEGKLNPDVPIVRIFQPARGLKYTPFSRGKTLYFKIPIFNERASYVFFNKILSNVFKSRVVDIRTPVIKRSCLIEICAVRFLDNANVYIDGELTDSFNQTTYLRKISFEEFGLHTLKVEAINEDGVKSIDIREFLVII
jgi:hypothetical protein